MENGSPCSFEHIILRLFEQNIESLCAVKSAFSGMLKQRQPFDPGLHRKDLIMDLLNVTAASIGSIIALFLLTKLIGNKQMSQLNLFDYINGITIGSIAAEMATSLEKDWWLPLTAMVVYALAAIVLSYISVKSMAARRVISGKPLILMDHDTIYEKNLLKGKIDLSEMLLQCRVNGYFNLSDLQTIILEPNGRMSFLPKSEKRPVIPEDLTLAPKQEFLVANVIIDGHIMEKNLQHAGKDTQWLNKQMQIRNISNLGDILLATCNLNNQVTFYQKTHQEMTRDILD